MKYFEPTYLIFLVSSVIKWLLTAKDIVQTYQQSGDALKNTVRDESTIDGVKNVIDNR
jgi:hypothetical protein